MLDIVNEVEQFLHPHFAFVTTPLSRLNDFQVSPIISAQLRGSEALCFFIVTAGHEFEDYQHKLTAEGDMLRVYLANELGSLLAEKTADRMEDLLQSQLTPKGLLRTNRFSPGYCDWPLTDQPRLFSLFDISEGSLLPTLTPSLLMIPIKSISGLIGIGHQVKRNDYPCGHCKLSTCYKRRKRESSE